MMMLLFITMIYEYYTNELKEEKEVILRTRSVMLNRNHADAHEHLYHVYFASNYVSLGFDNIWRIIFMMLTIMTNIVSRKRKREKNYVIYFHVIFYKTT